VFDSTTTVLKPGSHRIIAVVADCIIRRSNRGDGHRHVHRQIATDHGAGPSRSRTAGWYVLIAAAAAAAFWFIAGRAGACRPATPPFPPAPASRPAMPGTPGSWTC